MDNYIRFISLVNKNPFNDFKSLLNLGIKKYFNNEIKNMKLLYQASTDGFETEIFHKKCGGKRYTVTLVVIETNIIIGGFTELEWHSRNSLIEGNKGFIFSLNDQKIYYNKNKYRIYGSKKFGPYFEEVFFIKEKTGYSYKNPSYKYFDISAKDYSLVWKDEFSIKD